MDTDYERWKPLHWILAVPDVMERGGFDAIIGNPPFLGGQKISGALGTNVRDWFVNIAGRDERQRRSSRLLLPPRHVAAHQSGNLGLIATNTIAQGETREVGLDQMVADGFTITRAIQCGRGQPRVPTWNMQRSGAAGANRASVPRIADDFAVDEISTLLEPAGQVDGASERLARTRGSLSSAASSSAWVSY